MGIHQFQHLWFSLEVELGLSLNAFLYDETDENLYASLSPSNGIGAGTSPEKSKGAKLIPQFPAMQVVTPWLILQDILLSIKIFWSSWVWTSIKPGAIINDVASIILLNDEKSDKIKLKELINSGKAFNKFKKMVAAHGGSLDEFYKIDE